MKELYKTLGLKADLEAIGISAENAGLLLKYSPAVRNRLTLMRLQRCIG